MSHSTVTVIDDKVWFLGVVLRNPEAIITAILCTKTNQQLDSHKKASPAQVNFSEEWETEAKSLMEADFPAETIGPSNKQDQNLHSDSSSVAAL